MVKRGGKTAATGSAVVAAAVLVAAWVAWDQRQLTRERAFLHRLTTGTEDERLHAVKQLGEMRSARAVPYLLRQLRLAAKRLYLRKVKSGGTMFYSGDPRCGVGRWGMPVSEALITIGKPSVPYLKKAAASAQDVVSGMVAGVAHATLCRIHPEAALAEPFPMLDVTFR